MSMLYGRTAALSPAIQGPNAIVDPASGSAAAISGAPTTLWPLWRHGGMAYAIVSGLEIGYSGDNATISPGQALFDEAVTITQQAKIPVENLGATRVHFWLSETGQFRQIADSIAPPGEVGRCVYLGFVNLSAGHPVSADGSGRLSYSGSVYWRRTADNAKPTDTPPAYVQFFNLTNSGIYYWDGTAYRAVNPYDISTSSEAAPTASQVLLRFVAPRAFTVPTVTGCLYGKTGVAATAQTNLSLQKNGVEFAVLRWEAGGTVSSLVASSDATAFAVGDTLTIVAPVYPDATLAQIGISIMGLL